MLINTKIYSFDYNIKAFCECFKWEVALYYWYISGWLDYSYAFIIMKSTRIKLFSV